MLAIILLIETSLPPIYDLQEILNWNAVPNARYVFLHAFQIAKKRHFKLDFKPKNRKEQATKGWDCIVVREASNPCVLPETGSIWRTSLSQIFHDNLIHSRFFTSQFLYIHSDTHRTIGDQNHLNFNHIVWNSRIWWVSSGLFLTDVISSLFERFVLSKNHLKICN